MQSSTQPPKPRRFNPTKRTGAGPKSQTPVVPKEDKNMNTIPNSSSRRVTKGPVASSRIRVGAQPRAPLSQPKASAQKPASVVYKSVKPKIKSARATAANQHAPSPVPPLSLLPLDPNCNESSLPCLCCDGRSPQDNNSMFNHNHNNNNTISLRQQMQLPAPPGPLLQKQEDLSAEQQPQHSEEPQLDQGESGAACLENKNKSHNLETTSNAIKVDEDDDDDDSSGDIDIEEEEEPDNNDEDDDEDDDDDDTLVPSCCDCPPSLLDFSLSSSTSSSSTSISSCSDLDSDNADQSYSMCSSNDQDNLSFTLSPKVNSPPKVPESKPPARSLPSLPSNPFFLSSHSPVFPSSPDEGYPSAFDSPDYLGIKEDSDMNKLSLLDFLESVGEFGKMERFSQVIQVARWDLEGEQHWDVLRDRIDHLDRLEKVNREVKLAYIARLHEKGFDLSDLEEQDLSDIMDEMGNIDISWKLYKSQRGKMQDSQEFSDAGVDLTAPSDCDDPLAPDSLTPSPVKAPPKPPVRHASVTSDLHTYINISRETTSVAVPTTPTPLSSFSLNTTSPTFTTFRCEKSTPVSPPSIPPLPASKPVPYLTLYTAPSPTIPTPTPPIPPPRTRHLARKEAQRRAALQAEQEKSPVSLPPPTTRPPPLPPPPVISVSFSSPPAIPPPPALPPPPSFHALDVEIRKLLMLAGLTQAELLKLSPELGVCVGSLEAEEHAENIISRCVEPREYRTRDREEEEECDHGLVVRAGLSYRGKLDGELREDDKSKKKEESKDAQRTTSFSEMARRRRKNTAFMSEPYYSTGLCNSHDSNTDNYEILGYAPQLPSSPPPPPPPRPLPPIPSCAPPKVSTLPANSAQPERFDWLIAFTPESDGPPKSCEIRKCPVDTPKKLSSSSDSSSGSAKKVTTFKELRYRSKTASPPTKMITAPEPDPTVITPDPDLLYNLKWRRDKAGGDGSQWEYTSQAQALFMQPPPALTSMAALKEMLQRADEERGQQELCLSQKADCPVNDSSLWKMGREWEYENFKMEEEKVQDEVEVRGQADGERANELRVTAVRSVSFAGSVHRAESWMAEDVKPSVRGLGCSSLCLQEKKALVSAISVAVEAILAQFSASRTVVQKALLGDSTVNPSLGRLVLQCLCPALHSLLTDGLKPHQSDLIAGRRPNSAWSLVQASTRPGNKTQALFNLQTRVGELPQLKQSKHRFNAFILGLLNTKHLDFWLSQLQTCSGILETYYHPWSFMRLSLTVCQPQFEELLLVLQPLSLLTFNLDLLFQHHHLDNSVCQDTGPQVSNIPFQSMKSREKYMESLSEEVVESTKYREGSTLELCPNSADSQSNSSPAMDEDVLETSPQLRWVQEKEIGALPPPDIEDDSLAQQAGQAIQQGWEVMMRWGGRLSHNLAELSLTAEKKVELKTEPAHLQAHSDFVPLNSGMQKSWGLERLFGATKTPSSPTSHPAPTRRPSQWLAPGVTALTRIVSSSTAPILKRVSEPQEDSDKEVESLEMKDKPKPLRSVRTLCDHRGTGSELSFCKDEELVVLGGVDQDWIRCRRGDTEGLVPIGYTSLIM